MYFNSFYVHANKLAKNFEKYFLKVSSVEGSTVVLHRGTSDTSRFDHRSCMILRMLCCMHAGLVDMEGLYLVLLLCLWTVWRCSHSIVMCA